MQSDDKIDNPAREDYTAKWHQSGENCPSGNISDTLPGENGTYPLQGIRPGVGVALLERSAYAARELGPFSDKLDGFIGQLGLIAIKMMKQPLPDCSDDLAMLAAMVRR
jgi:hypothetical protein